MFMHVLKQNIKSEINKCIEKNVFIVLVQNVLYKCKNYTLFNHVHKFYHALSKVKQNQSL